MIPMPYEFVLLFSSLEEYVVKPLYDREENVGGRSDILRYEVSNHLSVISVYLLFFLNIFCFAPLDIFSLFFLRRINCIMSAGYIRW